MFLIPVYSPFSLPKVIMKITKMLEVQQVNQNTMMMLQESFITGRRRKPTGLPALQTGRENGMNIHLWSQIFPSGILWKANYIGQCHRMVPCVHTALGSGLWTAMREELGALYALWFPFLNHFGHKDTKGFVLLKRGGGNLWKMQV